MYYEHDCTSNDTSDNYMGLHHDPHTHYYECDYVSKDTSHNWSHNLRGDPCTMSMTVPLMIQVITT